MFKLPNNAGTNWVYYNGKYVPQTITTGCGYCMEHPLRFSTEGKSWSIRSDSMYITMKCPACKKDVSFWLIVRKNQENADNAPNVTDIFMEPDPPLAFNYDRSIDSISPSFSVIYQQALIAERNELKSLIGIGYRKALEFLLKDWIISENPSDADKIKKQNIGKCIQEYVFDDPLKICLERAVWLGNDETHYIREWPQKNIDDLKKLLEISLHIIAGKILIKNLPNDMPSREKKIEAISSGSSPRNQ